MQDCMNDVRSILQDTDATAYRVSDADLIRFYNFALFEIALRRPDLFSTFGDIPLTAGQAEQALPAGALRLMEIFRVKNGRVVKECSQDDLDSFDVNWQSAANAVTVNWVRHPRDPVQFFVSPPPSGGTTLRGQWAQAPAYTTDTTTNLPIADAYAPVVCDYMIWRAESRDDEFVSAPRAVLFLEAFNASLGVSAKTKATADSDVGNRDIQRQLAATTQASAASAAPIPAASQAAAIQNSGGF